MEKTKRTVFFMMNEADVDSRLRISILGLKVQDQDQFQDQDLMKNEN